MSNPAGSVDVAIGMNTVSFSAGVKKVQADLDKLGSHAKSASHGSITSVQSVSASLRALEGGFTNNLRSMERWVAQSKIATSVAATMFPIVGAGTFAFLLIGLVKNVADFIKKANEMPKAIEQGFNSMRLASETSTDALRLTNDQLQNSIDKLQGKPTNNLAIQLDEARISADKLATSLENDASKVRALLEQNKLSALGGLLTGQAGTASTAGTVNFGLQELQRLGFQNRQVIGKYGPNSPEAKKAQKDLADKQAYYQTWVKKQLFLRDNPQYATGDDNAGDMAGDQGANRNVLLGFQSVLNDEQENQAEQARHALLAPQKQKLDDEKAAAEKSKAAKSAALAAQKAADQAAIKAEQIAHDQWAATESHTLAEEVAYWAQRVAVTKTGSAAFIDARTQMWKAVTAQNRENTETTKRFSTEYMTSFGSSSGLSGGDSKKLDTGGQDALAFITSLRESINLTKQSSSALAENSVQMAVATGQMSRQDAARTVAAMHQQDYIKGLKELHDQAETIKADPTLSTTARQAALQNNANETKAFVTQGSIQAGWDAQATNRISSSPVVGAKDALDDFVDASRDAAGMMRDIVNTTLSGLNNQLISAMSSGHTDFRQFGQSVTRNIASKGLEKAEGSVLGALGFGGGKLGTKTNPMYTVSADKGIPSAASGLLGSGSMGKFFGKIKSFLPFLADGGPIDGPAIVGERGPELFLPSNVGNIIPNHVLTSSSGSGSTAPNISYQIDAKGTDPVQTEMRVKAAILQSHVASVSQAIAQSQDQARRKPGRAI